MANPLRNALSNLVSNASRTIRTEGENVVNELNPFKGPTERPPAVLPLDATPEEIQAYEEQKYQEYQRQKRIEAFIKNEERLRKTAKRAAQGAKITAKTGAQALKLARGLSVFSPWTIVAIVAIIVILFFGAFIVTALDSCNGDILCRTFAPQEAKQLLEVYNDVGKCDESGDVSKCLANMACNDTYRQSLKNRGDEDPGADFCDRLYDSAVY